MNLRKITPQSKKGTAGLDVAQKVFMALLVLGVMGFVFIVIFGHLTDTADDALPVKASTTVVNETLTTVTEAGEDLTVVDYYTVVCTITTVTNSSNSEITTGNYTHSNCNLISSGDGDFNNSDWKVTFDYTYKDSGARDVSQNLTSGASSFFSNSGTWLTLLSVVIIISIVTLVLNKVKGGKEGLGGSSGRNSQGDGLI